MKILKKILPISLLLIYFVIVSTIHLLVEKKHIVKQKASIVLNKIEDNKSLYGINHKNIMVELDADAYIKDYIFIGDTANITSILFNGIYLNKNLFVERDKNFTATYYNDLINANNKIYSIKNSFKSQSSIFFYFKNFLNWKGDFSFIKNVLVSPLVLFTFLFCILFYLYKKYRFVFKKTNVQIEDFKIPFYFIWLPFLLLFFIIFYQDNYYFLQDDNYAQFTPVLLKGLDGWYQQGSFPTYTPLQFNGVATFEYSTYSFLYPITHLSYLIAKYILHNSYQFNNVFAFIHFAVGYYFFIKLLKLFKINFFISVVAALSFIFCGFNLETSRSWYYIAPTIAFLPLLLYYIFTYCSKKLSLKNYVCVILLLVIYAYSGNFQFWLYTIIFCSAIYFYINKIPFKITIKTYLLVLILSSILFLPQLMVSFISMHNIDRVGGAGQGIVGGVGNILFPFFYKNALPNGWGSTLYKAYDYYFYYGGFVFILITFFYIIYSFINFKNFYNLYKQKNKLFIFAIVFLVSFILAFGIPGFLWFLQSKIPIFNKFNHPFKFLLFVQFFGTITGAIILNYFCKKYFNKFSFYFILIISFIIITLNVFNTKDAFFVFDLQNKPYSPAKYFNLLDTNNNYRIIPLSALRSSDSLFNNTLQMNFSMMQNIASADGYEPFCNNLNDNYKNHRELGIRYFIVSHHTPSSVNVAYLFNRLSKFKYYIEFNKIYSDNQIDILEDTLSEPLIQLYQNNQKIKTNIEILNKNNGVFFEINASKAIVNKAMLNYNFNENIFVYVNGKTIEKEKDSFNRMVIYPNQLVKTIEFKYIPKPFSFLYK